MFFILLGSTSRVECRKRKCVEGKAKKLSKIERPASERRRAKERARWLVSEKYKKTRFVGCGMKNSDAENPIVSNACVCVFVRERACKTGLYFCVRMSEAKTKCLYVGQIMVFACIVEYFDLNVKIPFPRRETIFPICRGMYISEFSVVNKQHT